MKTFRYCYLAAQAAFWTLAFRACCLISAECRQIRRECQAAGEQIDPLVPLLAEMRALELPAKN